jgi:hypothetical protein
LWFFLFPIPFGADTHNNTITMYTSAYFDITPPNQYSFLGFYQYRSKQDNFTFSFQKEAYTLKKNLESLLNTRNSSNSEIMESAKRLWERFGVSTSIRQDSRLVRPRSGAGTQLPAGIFVNMSFL